MLVVTYSVRDNKLIIGKNIIATFINYKNGHVTLNNYRFSGATATDVNDIIDAYESNKGGILTASLDLFIDEEIAKINLSHYDFEDRSEVADFILGEADFLDSAMNRLGLDHTVDPDLRNAQNDLIAEWEAN